MLLNNLNICLIDRESLKRMIKFTLCLLWPLACFSQSDISSADSIFFSYRSKCNIGIEFLSNKQARVFQDGKYSSGTVEKCNYDKECYSVTVSKDTAFNVIFSQGEAYIANQKYEIGCDDSKIILLDRITDLNLSDLKIYIDGRILPDSGESINNKAYYLQKYGDCETAAYLLSTVVEVVPARIVAYINLADCQWELGQKIDAMENYEKYVHLMQKQKKDGKIPDYVRARIR